MEIGKKFLLLLASLLATLLLVEAVSRFFPRLRPVPRTYVGEYENQPSKYWVTDPLLGWRMIPHLETRLYRSNSQGFRAPSDFIPNRPCKRIVLAGDSFTFGVGVRYEKIFGSLIEGRIPCGCVNNMGIPGYGLDQIWLTVRTQALPLHPRLVVVSFIGNDLSRSVEAYRTTEGFNKPTFKLVDGRLVQKTAADRSNFLVRFLQQHSSVWRIARFADRTLARRYPHGEWWYLNAAILDAIREDCLRAGVPVLFIYIPTPDWKAFPSMRSYMARTQANFIDLSQGEFAISPDMYIRGFGLLDGHLNDKGHQDVADAILGWLQQSLPAL